MKVISNLYRILPISLLMLVACDKDFLEKQPDENLNIEDVFSERQYAEGFLTSVYSHLPPMMSLPEPTQRNPFTGASDEMEITSTRAISHQFNSGAWSPTAAFVLNDWSFFYNGIRKANVFLDHVDKVPMDQRDKEQWKGEATFLRAYFHFSLVKMYGPVPLVDETITLADDWSLIRRQPMDELINFIVDECDKAVELLEWRMPPIRFGRITKPAALALKAQALLYMASPLFNGNPDYIGVVDDEGNRLFPDYDESWWRRAADAAKACIDGVEANGYGLYYASNGDPVSNYQELFLMHNNREVLLARNNGVWGHFERCVNPLGSGGYSIFCPTQEHVDAYEMANGERPILGYDSDNSPIINPVSGYLETGYAENAHPNGYYPAGVHNMYINRDPRFYASINFAGSIWKNRPMEFWFTGVDGRQRAGSDYCITGYLMKKMANPNTNIPQGQFGLNTWIMFRLAEQYLNYAEALNEVDGPVSDVYVHINTIRSRAGMPDLPLGLTQAEMRERIRQERRIELAFEAHRYFDTRRWKIAKDFDDRQIHGLNIQAGTNVQDDRFYQRTAIERRVFVAPRHYLWPIPIREIEKNENLVQNEGW